MPGWLSRLLRGPQAGAPPEGVLDGLVREALALREAGRFADAERALYRALALAPGAAEIQLLLGDLFRAQGRHESALQCCLAAVELAPRLAAAHNNLGNAYRDLGRLREAEAGFRRALVLEAALPEAHFNLGLTLQLQGRADEAMASYREALRHKPDFAAAALNLGYVLEERLDTDAAIRAYRDAIAAEPGQVEAHVNLGMQLLLAGRYAEGWEEYEWRLRYPEYSGADAAAKAPRWDGGALAGRTILLDAEQGFGDAIQFLRYAPLVATRGGRVVVRCAPELATLAASVSGVAAVLRRGEPLPGFDVWCPLPSLPRAFGTTLADIPLSVPYLSAEAEKAARWRERFAGERASCRVGLVWASQSAHRTAAAKSVALAEFAPLSAVPGVRLYSLQKGDAARDALRLAPRMRITDLSTELEDFGDTAAALAGIDVVISVDTAVAHLAGALGRPAWTLLKFAPDWRWLLAREDSPWYPTMRLFRQERAGDWRSPVARVVEAVYRKTAETPA